MRVVFFGTPDIALPCLEAVAAHHEVAAVVTQPDRPKGRRRKPAPPPVKVRAEAEGLPVHQPAKLNDGTFEAWLREQAPDLCVVAAYGRLLKQPIIDVPPKGYLNLHPSLLPRWRGPSPIRTAILEGDAETGVTIMKLVLEMDAGDILVQRRTPIEPDEDAVALSERLARLGAEAMLDALAQVECGTAEFTPQNPAAVTTCSIFRKEDGRIRWDAPAEGVHNLVRAAVPWPVAHCLFRGEVFRIHRTALTDASAQAAPGTITTVEKDRMLVACADRRLAILEIQAPGKRAMATGEFLRGAHVEPGERFEEIGDAG